MTVMQVMNHTVFTPTLADKHADDSGVALQEAKPIVKRPPRYQVVMLNDDYTPMEFVVHVLQNFFSLDLEQATHVMLTVHTKGRAVCGVFTRDIAETKADIVNRYARDNEHPLVCEIDAADDDNDDSEQ